MTLLLHAALGFLAPHFGSVIDLIKHVRLGKLEKEKSENLARLEIERVIQTPTPPAGARFISALQNVKYPIPKWIIGIVLLLYTGLDWIASGIRPGVTWFFVALWASHGLQNGWNAEDQHMLVLMLSYWFSDLTLTRKKK